MESSYWDRIQTRQPSGGFGREIKYKDAPCKSEETRGHPCTSLDKLGTSCASGNSEYVVF